MFFVDTGAAGSGFIGTESFLREAGINPAEGKSAESVGGGGMMKFTTFRVAHLSLGSAQGIDIPGSFGQFPTSLEYGQGFRIAGIVSHAFFRPYALTFDFARMKLVLEKASPGNNTERFTAVMNKIVACVNAGDYEQLREDFSKAMSDGLYSALGNALFVEHRPGEVSVLAHLKLDSLRVKLGDHVRSGQVLGLSGNSGNSTRPHLH